MFVRGVRLQSKEIFNAADDDENGALDLDEVAEMLKNMLGREMDPQEALRVQREMDTDGDGQIAFGEFVEWMLQNNVRKIAMRLLSVSTKATPAGRGGLLTVHTTAHPGFSF